MPDITKPYIVKTTPAVNTTGVNPYSNIYVQFSERMLESSLTTTNIGLYEDPLVSIPITISYNDGIKLVTIVADSMTVDTRYAVVVSGSIQDLAGNTMGQDYWWNFWTTTPSGWVPPSTEIVQLEPIVLNGYLEVDRTLPINYSTSVPLANISPVRVFLTDSLAIGNRNYMGDGTSPNPLVLGVGFFEDPEVSISSYISVSNMEVLGDQYIAHTAPTITYDLSSDKIISLGLVGVLDNNEYIITVRKGLEGLNTNPLTEDYQFVFTSNYTPLYSGYNIIRLRIGPLLQQAMAYVPNDTLNRFIYEASKEAVRLHRTTFSTPPWYVTEFVIYQGTLSALYAALTIFAASGAGVRKQLADLMIEKDARGLMPAINPILDDLRKLRDKYMELVIAGSDRGTTPIWARKGLYDPRRPISDASWRRLPLRSYQDGIQQPVYYQTREEYESYVQWIYTYELTGGGL